MSKTLPLQVVCIVLFVVINVNALLMTSSKELVVELCQSRPYP